MKEIYNICVTVSDSKGNKESVTYENVSQKQFYEIIEFTYQLKELTKNEDIDIRVERF